MIERSAHEMLNSIPCKLCITFFPAKACLYQSKSNYTELEGVHIPCCIVSPVTSVKARRGSKPIENKKKESSGRHGERNEKVQVQPGRMHGTKKYCCCVVGSIDDCQPSRLTVSNSEDSSRLPSDQSMRRQIIARGALRSALRAQKRSY
jgi:hypothetical protein